MAKTRVPIYAKDLSNHLELIKMRVTQNGNELRRIADEMNPPYPIIGIEDNLFHLPSTTIACDSAIRALRNGMKATSMHEWNICIKEYLNIPERISGKQGDQQDFEDVSFTEDMVASANEIGEYLESEHIKVPFLRSRGNFSYKVLGNMALIWLGRQLAQEKETVDESAS